MWCNPQRPPGQREWARRWAEGAGEQRVEPLQCGWPSCDSSWRPLANKDLMIGFLVQKTYSQNLFLAL